MGLCRAGCPWGGRAKFGRERTEMRGGEGRVGRDSRWDREVQQQIVQGKGTAEERVGGMDEAYRMWEGVRRM